MEEGDSLSSFVLLFHSPFHVILEVEEMKDKD